MTLGVTPEPEIWSSPQGQKRSAAESTNPLARVARRLGKARAWAIVIVLAVVAGGLTGGMVARIATPSATAPAVSDIQPPELDGQFSFLSDLPAVISSVQRSVVSIEFETAGLDFRGRPVTERGSGTGFVFAEGGLIATNAHNVADASTVAVTLPDGRTVEGKVVGISQADDLAVIRVAEAGLEPLPVGRSGSLRVGESVIVVGYALALPGGPTASLGIVSALGRSVTTSDGQEYLNLIQTDAAVNSGDSGGPLVDMRGRVAGINTVATTTAESIGFAIGIDEALPILRRLAETGR